MKLSLQTILLALACILPAAAFAQQDDSGQSPSGKLSYEVRGTDEKAVWVWESQQKEISFKLCDTMGSGNLKVNFSPDDYWIIVQDGGASLGISLRLFRRNRSADFQEVKDADIDGKAERLALQQGGLPAKEISDHRYAACLFWSADSRTVLIGMTGRGETDGSKVRYHWAGVYDLGTGTFGTDLGKVNRGAVEKTPRG